MTCLPGPPDVAGVRFPEHPGRIHHASLFACRQTSTRAYRRVLAGMERALVKSYAALWSTTQRRNARRRSAEPPGQPRAKYWAGFIEATALSTLRVQVRGREAAPPTARDPLTGTPTADAAAHAERPAAPGHACRGVVSTSARSPRADHFTSPAKGYRASTHPRSIQLRRLARRVDSYARGHRGRRLDGDRDQC